MSRQDKIRRLITNHNRRLQALKEKQALYGLETPVSILTEIEDIEAAIEELQAQLKQFENRDDNFSSNLGKGLIANNLRWIWIGVGIVLIVTVLRVGMDPGVIQSQQILTSQWVSQSGTDTLTSQSVSQSTDLNLVDVSVIEENVSIITEFIRGGPAKRLLLDIKVRNTSDKVVFLKEANFYIHHVVDVSRCCIYPPATGSVTVSEVYDIELDHKKAPYTATLKISQSIPPNDVDRFQFNIAGSEREERGIILYLVDLTLVYNETNDKLLKENILLWPPSLIDPRILELPADFSKPPWEEGVVQGEYDGIFLYLYEGLHVEGPNSAAECFLGIEGFMDLRRSCVEENITELKKVLEMSSVNYARLDYLRSLVNEAEQSFKPK